MACTCQPGKGLCNSCLQPIYERNPIGTQPVDNGNGEYTLAQVDIFEQKFKQTIVEDINNNPLTEYVKRYPTFYETVKEINNGFLKRPNITSQLPDYEVLNARLEKGPITALEWASFMKSSNYTPSGAIESSNAKGSRFLDELNSYYNGDFSDSIMGGFCATFNSIFGAINSFFDMLNKIDGFIQDVLGFITKIRNIKDIVLEAFEKLKVKALIELIKKKIKDMVAAAIRKVCQSIANFDVTSIIGNIPNPPVALIRATEKAEEKKTFAQEACGGDAIERIKAKIQAVIDYAIGLFSNPSVEEIIMLMARLCGMAAGIEGLFKQLKDPLNDFANRYDEVVNTLSNASNRVTGEAIRAGAIRPTEENRQKLINNAKEVWYGITGDSPEGTNANIIPPSVKEIADVPSWDQIKDNSHPKIRIQGGWTTKMENPHEGWNKLLPDVRVKLMRLHARATKLGIINGPLYVNSCYRSPAYNTKVGGAKSSQHMKGTALDLTWPGFPRNRDAFRAAAEMEGFKGFGMNYNSFIHCDVGPRREW